MKYISIFSFFICFFVSFLFFGCQNNKQPRNEAEIVERDTDTSFNAIPGKEHQGRSVGEEDFVLGTSEVATKVLIFNGMNQFSKGLGSAGMTDELNKKEAITIFAPTDEAFDNLDEGMFQASNEEALRNMLKYHIVEGIFRVEDLKDGIALKNLAGEELTVAIDGNKLKVDGSSILSVDLSMKNGIIHKIDKVLKSK